MPEKTNVGGPKASVSSTSTSGFQDKEKPVAIRASNMMAAKKIADAVRTSLGPKGMDKMICSGDGDVAITNDGATILKQMEVLHPAAKMLVELSKAQDIEAGDGTTSVVVVAGSLLDAAQKLLAKGIHPTSISDGFQKAATYAQGVLETMAVEVELKDRNSLLKTASTALNSKVVSQYSSLLSPIAVDAVMKVVDASKASNVNLRDIKIVKKLGGTLEDCQLVNGVVFTEKASGAPGAPTKIDKAKIGLIQFCLSPPKTDMENQVIITDYAQMDKALKEERVYILNLVKAIKKSGCNVLLIQKSILRDAINDLALHFLAKMKIMVIRDIEREDIEFVTKSLGCRPIASIDHCLPDHLGYADCVESVQMGSGKIVKVTGVAHPGKTVCVLLRGSNKLVLDEAERSLHDALCVIRCLVKKKALIAGGSAPEVEMALRVSEQAAQQTGLDAYCFRAFAEALEVIPYTLAENAGLNPIGTVTELRNKHSQGHSDYGINVRKGSVTSMLDENVIQPLLVSLSCIKLATETVRSLLKIDGIVPGVN